MQIAKLFVENVMVFDPLNACFIICILYAKCTYFLIAIDDIETVCFIFYFIFVLHCDGGFTIENHTS